MNEVKHKKLAKKQVAKIESKKHKYKKRRITFSDTTSRKLKRLERRLEKLHDNINELKINKSFFIKKLTGLDVAQDNKVTTVQEQRNLLEEITSVYSIDTKSSDLLGRLIRHNVCKRYLITETCDNDCRFVHDTSLRYYYINHFKPVLRQLQERFEISNLDSQLPISFKDTSDKNVFLSLFVYYYRDLLHLVHDYEGKIDEYQNSLNIPQREHNNDVLLDDNQSLEKEINKLLTVVLRKNKALRKYRDLLISFDKKYEVGLSNYTKYMEVDVDDTRTRSIGKYLKRILNMFIEKENTKADSSKQKTESTFGVDASFSDKQQHKFKGSAKDHGFFLCNECGFRLSLKDNEQRLLKHFQGKTHLKYANLWDELGRLEYIFRLLDVDPQQYKPLEVTNDNTHKPFYGYNKRYTKSSYKDTYARKQNTIYYGSVDSAKTPIAYNSRRFVERHETKATSGEIRSQNTVFDNGNMPVQPPVQAEKLPIKQEQSGTRRTKRSNIPSIEY